MEKGIPNSLEELIDEVKNACGLEGHIRLQYKDTDFGNIFVNLTSTSVIRDLTILKVVQLDPDTTTVVLYPVDPSISSNTSVSGLDSDDSSVSAHTDDTVLLISPSPDSLRTQQWPQVFQIPNFSYDTECQLQKANVEYMKSQTKLTPSSKMLSGILEKLAESMYAYTPYPEDGHYSDVAEALTRKHPCLREPGSFKQSYGWKQRLKIKMANYRTQLKAHGTSAELTVNSLKAKIPGDAFPAKNVKRPRRAEVNHFPSFPIGETTESLEQERISLLAEMQKRNNQQTVKAKMAKTFGYRRQEIVQKQPTAEEILVRWPALFLMEETVDITIKREAVLKALIYLGEPVEHLFKAYQDEQENDQLQLETMAIFVTGREDPFHPPKDIKIIIDGTQVLDDVPSVATAVAMFYGLIYALNLKYPKNLQHALEFFQKVLMELGGKNMSSKVYRLSTQLHSC